MSGTLGSTRRQAPGTPRNESVTRRSAVSIARIGAHVSTLGGISHAVPRARELGATALQVFVKSARQWKAASIDPGEIKAFRSALEEHGLVGLALAHASYLINLAAPDEVIWERSVVALSAELQRCAALGISGLVVHPGSHRGSGEEAGRARVVAALDRVLADHAAGNEGDGNVTILLENTAGQGDSLGASLDDLGHVLRRCRQRARLGVCIDTCHAHAAGYGLSSVAEYRASMAALDRAVGLDAVRAFHLNDSVGGLGSRRDRHASIGAGTIGLAAFRRLVRDPRFAGLPMIVETPLGEDGEGHRRDVATLRELARRRRR